jgi:Zn-dependent protease with chaperone function
MKRGSVAAATTGVLLLTLIWIAGVIARTHRNVLLILFRPGLYATGATVTILILVHAVLAITAIYYGESAATGRIHTGIILGIGLGAMAGVVAVGKNAFSLVKKAETIAVGTSVSRAQAPLLWKAVDDTASSLGSLRPDHIIIGLDPSFFVTEAEVISFSGRLSGRTLFCSLPLARILTKTEFVSIIGHELGHFRGEDTKFSAGFYPIYRGTASSLESLQAAGEGARMVALLPALAVFGYFLEAFAIAENLHSRQRELLADAAGAEVTTATDMAVALVKVHAFASAWREVQEASAEAMKRGKVFVNASTVFAEAIADRGTPEALKGIADTFTSHPTDSHPPLGVRLEALGKPLHALVRLAIQVRPSEAAAIGLVADYEVQEEKLSELYQNWLAHKLGIEAASAPEEAESTGV